MLKASVKSVDLVRHGKDVDAITALLEFTGERWEAHQPNNPIEFLADYDRVKVSVKSDIKGLLSDCDLSESRLLSLLAEAFTTAAPLYKACQAAHIKIEER